MARRFRKYLSAGATFAVALGIGFAMQNGDALAARFGTDTALADAPMEPQAAGLRVTAMAPGFSPSGGIVANPVVAASLVTPASARSGLTLPAVHTAGARSGPPALPAAAPIDPARSGAAAPSVETACVPALEATPTPGAMVDLVLAAPCAPATVAVIHHGGMMLSLLTDAAGEARASVPALGREAVFVVDIAGLPGATAAVEVPDIARFERAVLQWQGDLGLGLQALESGGGAQAWVGSDRSVDSALAGDAAFVSVLGDPGIAGGYRARVYSRPVEAPPVTLDVEAAILPATCGRQIAAQTIQVTPGGPTTARDLSLRVPDCAAVGEYLVLSNLLRDLTLAMR